MNLIVTTTAFAAPVTSLFQRAAHLIDAGYRHSEAGNLYKEDDQTIYSTDAPFTEVHIMHKRTATSRMRLEVCEITWG